MNKQKEQEYFFTISQNSIAEFKDRGSRFIAYAFPIETIEEFKQHISTLKNEHPKAVHHCFAYRLGFDGNLFRANDDGEPSGTAGKPILGQIDSKQLTNILIVIVRYFGGTLLGVPGLINAYKTAASLALQTTPIIKKPIVIIKEFEFDYTKMNDIMLIVKQNECSIIRQEHRLFCSLTIAIPKAKYDFVLSKISNVIER
ncbi:MAG: YigZ family protein [Chitinophagales bacterium]|nr:YigZ family protein [Chitinophagales bacterium]